MCSRRGFESALQRDSQKLTFQGWTRNLSEGGLNAFVAHALALGESVVLEIRLSNSGKHAIPAQVVRVLRTEYGFQFTALSVEQRSQIRATLEAYPAIPYQLSTARSGQPGTPSTRLRSQWSMSGVAIFHKSKAKPADSAKRADYSLFCMLVSFMRKSLSPNVLARFYALGADVLL